jgi:hypothetical protein
MVLSAKKWFCHQDEGFRNHVFSSIYMHAKYKHLSASIFVTSAAMRMIRLDLELLNYSDSKRIKMIYV